MKIRSGRIPLKRSFCLLLAFLLSLSFAGCGENDRQSTASSGAVEVYTKKAKQLMDEGNYEAALRVLEEGVSATGDGTLEDMLDAIQAVTAVEAETAKEEATPPASESAGEPEPTAFPTQEPVPTPVVSAEPPVNVTEAVETRVWMNDDQQYEANIFLSNFSEQYLTSYDMATVTIFDLVNFAYMYLSINRPQDVSYENGYEIITFDTVKELSVRFFGISPIYADAQDYPYNDLTHYADGKFYFMNKFLFQPSDYTCFSVVDELYQEPDGSYRMSFHIYSNDSGVQGVYHLTPAQADSTAGITLKGEGTALAVGYSYNGRSTYRLLSYRSALY